MTPADLDAVVARTGHERFRWLTSDDNPDAESREGYRRIVRELAAGTTHEEPQEPAAPAPGRMTPWRRAKLVGGLRCFYAGRPKCGCAGSAYCHWLTRDVTLRDCRDCLEVATPPR